MKYRLFSVDDHMMEPPNVWQDRLPAKYKEAGPRVIETESGKQSWLINGKQTGNIGINTTAGRPLSRWNENGNRYDEIHPGCWQPKARAEAFRADGVVASIGFPDAVGFGGWMLSTYQDRTLGDLCVRAWNDWMYEEWCAAAPDLFVPVMICQLWDPVAAAAEVRRCAARGVRTLTFPESPHLGGLPTLNDPAWNPLWEALEETQVVVSMHGGSSGGFPWPAPDAPLEGLLLGAPAVVGAGVISVLVTGPAARKFPGLKFVLTEACIGYMPWLIERMKNSWARHGAHYIERLRDVSPFEIYQRSIWVCTVHEKFGLAHRHAVGMDKILWESDFPHSESHYPESQQTTEALFAGIPRAEVDQITHGNAQSLFRFQGESQ